MAQQPVPDHCNLSSRRSPQVQRQLLEQVQGHLAEERGAAALSNYKQRQGALPYEGSLAGLVSYRCIHTMGGNSLECIPLFVSQVVNVLNFALHFQLL